MSIRNPLNKIQPAGEFQQRIPQNFLISLSSPAVPTVMAIIWYIGNGTATFATSRATSTATFTDTGSGTLPNDGTSAAGTINYALAAADTMGEVADIINASTSFRMRLASCIRSATPLALATLATTTLTAAGAGLLSDNAPATLTIAYTNDGLGKVTLNSTTMVFTDTGTAPTLPNDGTSAAGTLTYSVATVDTLTELAIVINLSNDFTATLSTNIPGTTASNKLRTHAQATITTGTAFPIDISTGQDTLYLCFGPESDLSLYQNAQLPNFARCAGSQDNYVGSYHDPNKTRSNALERGVGRIHNYDSVARLLGFAFTATNAAGSETPTLTLYDSSQSLDTQIGTFIGADATELSLYWDTPYYPNQQLGGGEYLSTPGNRLVLALTSPITTFLTASLRANGVYGGPGVEIYSN